MSFESSEVPRRGRPIEADPDQIARVALRLFIDRGFDETSMEEVATASGVSRRTLFRYFPSKSALVWGGALEASERVRAALDAAPSSEPTIEALRRAWVDALTFPAALVEVTRSRLLLISRHEALRVYGLHGTEPLVDIVAEFIARRTGAAPHDLGPRVVSAAASASITATLYWWAEFGEGEPQVVVDGVLARLDRGLVGWAE